MSRVTELEKALTTLFRKGTEVGYTETEIDEFLENIDYHALLQAVWNKAETVYAYRADGKNALSLDYRSAELFKQRATLLYEDVDAIGKTLKELELAGYIIRRQLRGKDGRISDTEYTIFEKPRKPSPPDTTLPDTENPYLDNPDTEAPDTDNPAQLNTKKSNTQKSNTDLSSTHSFFLPAADGMTDGFEKKAEIREQIEYDILCQQYDRMQLDELVEIMLEVAMNRSPTVKIGRDAEYPTGFVQQRFEKITSMHIEKVMDGIRENTTRVWNTKAYLMAALFNSVSTIDNHYAMLVNHDFHGGP